MDAFTDLILVVISIVRPDLERGWVAAIGEHIDHQQVSCVSMLESMTSNSLMWLCADRGQAAHRSTFVPSKVPSL